MDDKPTQQDQLIQNYPLIHSSSKLQMPANNILIFLKKKVKKKVKQIQSSKIIEAPIHQMASYRESKAKNESNNEGNAYISQYGRLKISLIQEKRKKRQSFNSSCRSIYDYDIKKSKSLFLKKDFQSAFKRLIGKKPLSSKQKQTKVSHELWSSMKVKKKNQLKDKLTTQCLITQRSQRPNCIDGIAEPKTSNKSEQRLIKKAFNSYFIQPQATPKISKFCLSGPQFNKANILYGKLRDNKKLQMPDHHLKTHIKAQGQIKPWNIDSRRYKSQTNEEKSGEITEWLIGKKDH